MGQFIIDLLNSIILAMAGTLTFIFDLLPSSPFQNVTSTLINQYLPYLNWLIPISTILAELQLLIPCFIAWYTWSIILRWIKAVE